jgi:hypothetical protein
MPPRCLSISNLLPNFLDSSELSETAHSVEDASLLCDLLAEVAIWRKHMTPISENFGEKREGRRVDVGFNIELEESDE